MKMSKVIVTGGAGFIGSHLTDRLIEEGYEVVVIDNLSTGKKENLNEKADFHQLDIREFEKINPLFQGAEIVFHLAAIPRVPLSVEKPLLTSHVNVLGTINVFHAAIKNKVRKVIFASSSSVYGNQKELPLRETMTPNPISPYGLQKLTGEHFANLFSNLYETPIVSLRFFNVYGPRLDFNSDYSLVIGKFLKQKKRGEPLTIYGTGEQTRGFCYVDDIINGMIAASQSDQLRGGEVINLGNSESYSINDLARLIGGPVRYLPPRKGDILHTKADTSLAAKLLDWQPEISFEEGLRRTKEWFENQLKKLGL